MARKKVREPDQQKSKLHPQRPEHNAPPQGVYNDIVQREVQPDVLEDFRNASLKRLAESVKHANMLESQADDLVERSRSIRRTTKDDH